MRDQELSAAIDQIFAPLFMPRKGTVMSDYEQDLSTLAHEARLRSIDAIECEQRRPAAIFHPRISIDGNKWCALYGENLQDGVAGFGDSPSLAMDDFDIQWFAKLALASPPAAHEQSDR